MTALDGGWDGSGTAKRRRGTALRRWYRPFLNASRNREKRAFRGFSVVSGGSDGTFLLFLKGEWDAGFSAASTAPAVLCSLGTVGRRESSRVPSLPSLALLVGVRRATAACCCC